MNTDNRDDHRSLENELRAALTHRAEQVRPSDRWEEIAMNTTKAPTTTRRWPIVLLAAAAVLAVVAGTWFLRPQATPTVPATPSPTASATDASPSPSASPSATPSGTPSTSETGFGGTVPVYYIAPEALGWPESGLGLRRVWVPADTPDTPVAKAKAALVIALGRPTATEGQIKAWDGVSLSNIVIDSDRITVTLSGAPSADIADNIAGLAVQQLVWTAQAAVGQGNLPVQLTTTDGASRLWTVDISAPFTRPARAQQYTVLTDLWITEPSYPEGGTAVVPAGRPLKISGEATVFEANVQWQLSDATGRVVDQGFVTASAGAPNRGTFDISVTIPDAGEYVLKAFAVSMKDGVGEVANDSVSLTVR